MSESPRGQRDDASPTLAPPLAGEEAAAVRKPIAGPEEEPASPLALGIDVGGTGVKAALVDVAAGHTVGERWRMPTPDPPSQKALTEAVKSAYKAFADCDLAAVGIGFPAVIRRGVVLTAKNIGSEWRYVNAAEHFSEVFGRPVDVLNDGDAAGLAEVRFGAGKGVEGVLVVVTLGTGVGTSLVVDGRLVPNIELGRIRVRGKAAGDRASNRARKEGKRSWKSWAADVEEFIQELDLMTWPDLVIIGGGVSERAHEFLQHISARPTIVPAKLRNDAGIVGAALYAYERQSPRA